MIDTLIAMIDIENYNESAKNLHEILEKKKNEAKSALTENQSKIICLQIGDMTFEVLPNGKKGYAYILHNDLYEIDLAQYRSKNKDFYPVYVKIKSECLWSFGPKDAWNHIYKWVDDNIGKIINNKISRIDLCCHTDELMLTPEDSETFKGQFYTHNIYFFRRKVTGMNFGSSASNKVYCRIYDKVLEITQKKSKKWFYQIWKDEKLDCKKVWNIEFQINREFLKDHYINTVLQAYDSLGSIWEYCTKFWLVKIIEDNKNISRCSTDETWKKVQQSFEHFKHRPLIKREKQLNDDADAIIPGAYGIFTTFAAKKGITDISMALKVFGMNGNRYLKSKKLDFEKVVNKKQALLHKVSKKEANTGEDYITICDTTIFN